MSHSAVGGASHEKGVAEKKGVHVAIQPPDAIVRLEPRDIACQYNGHTRTTAQLRRGEIVEFNTPIP